jgi:hypothetical protein
LSIHVAATDSGWKNPDPGYGMEKYKSRINIPDRQHWVISNTTLKTDIRLLAFN